MNTRSDSRGRSHGYVLKAATTFRVEMAAIRPLRHHLRRRVTKQLVRLMFAEPCTGADTINP